jgi:hypothetical protein
MGEESNLILEQRPDSNAGRIILSRQSDTTGRCLDFFFVRQSRILFVR